MARLTVERADAAVVVLAVEHRNDLLVFGVVPAVADGRPVLARRVAPRSEEDPAVDRELDGPPRSGRELEIQRPGSQRRAVELERVVQPDDGVADPVRTDEPAVGEVPLAAGR